MKTIQIYALLATIVLYSCPADANETATEHPLSSFAGFIGGQWHLDGSYTELDWGVGRQAVTARSYFIIDGEPKLVSEGFWFWHPGEQQIKGIFTAIEMPVVLFLYTTRFEGDTMIGNLKAYGANGKETEFVETWKLEDEARFTWTLVSEMADGQEQSMSGTYTRQQ